MSELVSSSALASLILLHSKLTSCREGIAHGGVEGWAPTTRVAGPSPTFQDGSSWVVRGTISYPEIGVVCPWRIDDYSLVLVDLARPLQ